MIVENLPRLLPRAYSVASLSGAESLKFAFNVIELPGLGSLSERKGLITGKFDSLLDRGQDTFPKVQELLPYMC